MNNSVKLLILKKFNITVYRLPVFERVTRDFAAEIGHCSSNRELNFHLNVIIDSIVEDLINWTTIQAHADGISDSRMVIHSIPDGIFRDVFKKVGFQFPNLADRCELTFDNKKFVVSIY